MSSSNQLFTAGLDFDASRSAPQAQVVTAPPFAVPVETAEPLGQFRPMVFQPFNGIGYVGYDNTAKKIQSIWMDSAATGMMWMTGNADAGGKVVTAKGSMSDPMSGKSLPMEDKITIVDNDHHKMEMWTKGPGGKMMKMMEIDYTRKK